MSCKSNQAASKEFLGALYKNMKMGADSIIQLLPKVEDGDLRQEMTAQLNRYEELSKKIGEALYEAGGTPKEEGTVTKLMTKMGMAMNTAMDQSASHLAQIMIEGATMGITENTKLIREYENKRCGERALSLGRSTVRFMEDSVERMKRYL